MEQISWLERTRNRTFEGVTTATYCCSMKDPKTGRYELTCERCGTSLPDNSRRLVDPH